MLTFQKSLFSPTTDSQVSHNWVFNDCCFCGWPLSQLCSFVGSLTSLKHGHPTWRVADTHRIHTNLRIYQLYPDFLSWHQDEQVIATGTLTVISPISSFVTYGHRERRASCDKVWGVKERYRPNAFCNNAWPKIRTGKIKPTTGAADPLLPDGTSLCLHLALPLGRCALRCSAPLACILGRSL